VTGQDWFSTELDKGLSRVYNNSHVQAFVDAEEYYSDLRSAVEATASGGQICWIGFEGGAEVPMPTASSANRVKPLPPRAAGKDDVTWFSLLAAASGRHVAIRALLNLHPKPDMNPSAPKKYKSSNLDLVDKLNGLPTCLAINDFRYLWMNGTHHQKLVLVYNTSGLAAYVGTCDVERSRIANAWCEVQCKIRGDVAAELYEVFHRRWAEHSSVFSRAGSVNSYLKPVSDLKLTAPVSGNFLMQTSTTYGNPGRLNPFNSSVLSGQPAWQVVNQAHRVLVHSDSMAISAALLAGGAPVFFGNDFFTEVDPVAAPLMREAEQQKRDYSFAPNGHTGIYRAIKKAIETTRQYIYLEDQYLVSDVKMSSLLPMLDLLVAKVKEPQFKKLIIFCTRIDDINEEFQGTGWKHRNNFVSSLVSAGKEKVVVCQYKSRGALKSSFGKPHEGAFYIHSKTWIFDDEFLITGSANCNRRGYSHDSELDVGIYDSDKAFVRNLRVRLWKNRLNTEGIAKQPLEDAQLSDFLSAARYWEAPKDYGLTIENNRERSLEPTAHPDLDVGSYKAKVTGAPGARVVLNTWIDNAKMTGMWDLVVDPDGT